LRKAFFYFVRLHGGAAEIPWQARLCFYLLNRPSHSWRGGRFRRAGSRASCCRPVKMPRPSVAEPGPPRGEPWDQWEWRLSLGVL